MGIAKAALVPGTIVGKADIGSLVSPLQDIASNAISFYPCRGLVTTTSPTGIWRESPEPLPGHDYSAQPVGAPICVHARVGQTLTITTFTVTSAAGAKVAPVTILTAANDSNHLVQVNEAIYYQSVPLAATTTYNVTIVSTNNGTAFTKTFSFSIG